VQGGGGGGLLGPIIKTVHRAVGRGGLQGGRGPRGALPKNHGRSKTRAARPAGGASRFQGGAAGNGKTCIFRAVWPGGNWAGEKKKTREVGGGWGKPCLVGPPQGVAGTAGGVTAAVQFG